MRVPPLRPVSEPFLCVAVSLQLRHRVPPLCRDLQEQAVLVREPGPSGDGGQNGDPAHLARVRRLPEGQQQRGPEAAGRRQIHFSVGVRTQRQAGQSGHLLAHRPDRADLLEAQLPPPEMP
ncbi:hypothetical protein EYF80_059797 [Liparis tanakae]|uniref:Uncharacterized protein n=1 Tax=Liparis tanakae TaxID=230148 RepID=A0A4Z2EN99_9TELE|nr:hypothetical protein EYF80_059797 [Liparis tanakae]